MIDVLLSPTLVCSVVMSVEIDVILPSALVTLVSIPDIAVALPVMFVFAVVKLDCRLVMSDA